MRIHLTTFIRGVLGPDRGINASSDLDIGGVGRIVGTQNVTLRHGGSQLRCRTVAVGGGTALVFSHRGDTIPSQHDAESGAIGDGVDSVLGSIGGASGRSKSLCSQSS